MRDVLPSHVFRRIAEHLRKGSTRAEEGWEHAQDDEDTVTGDFLSSLRTGWRDREGQWHWRIRYKKFRGRGPAAEEQVLGADGIVQVEIDDRRTGHVINKGLLFQAKKFDNRARSELLDQVRKMEDVVPNGSAVFEYGPEQYRAVDGSAVIDHKARLDFSAESDAKIGNYLADRFLACEIGMRGCFYEAVSRTLVVPDRTSGVLRVRARLKHRLRIEVRRT